MDTNTKKPRGLRSPRCQTCKARKVKCDYALPRCGPCTKSKLHCEPHQKSVIFVAVDPHKAKTAEVGPHLAAAVWSDLEKDSRAIALPTSAQLVRSPMTTGSVIRGGLFDQFLRFYFPNKSHCLDLSSYRWVSTITENRSDFLLVETTACALGSLMVSRANEDKALERESLQLYGSALGHTRELWEQMNRKNWFIPLLGVSMLLLFESLYPSILTKTLHHGLGVSTILKTAGPEAFQQPDSHCLFLHARMALAYVAILEEKPSFLSETAWNTVPWRDVPKSPLHMGVDALLNVPKVLQTASELASAATHDDEYSHLLKAFGKELDAVKRQIQKLGAHFHSMWSATEVHNIQEFTAMQNNIACGLMLYEAQRRDGQALDIPEFSHHATETTRNQASAISKAVSIITAINALDADYLGLIGLRLLFIAARAAVQCLQREGLDSRDDCMALLETFRSRGFHFLLEVL